MPLLKAGVRASFARKAGLYALVLHLRRLAKSTYALCLGFASFAEQRVIAPTKKYEETKQPKAIRKLVVIMNVSIHSRIGSRVGSFSTTSGLRISIGRSTSNAKETAQRAKYNIPWRTHFGRPFPDHTNAVLKYPMGPPNAAPPMIKTRNISEFVISSKKVVWTTSTTSVRTVCQVPTS